MVPPSARMGSESPSMGLPVGTSRVSSSIGSMEMGVKQCKKCLAAEKEKPKANAEARGHHEKDE
jgi:hypothetical protein